jgi:hypothetical protein
MESLYQYFQFLHLNYLFVFVVFQHEGKLISQDVLQGKEIYSNQILFLSSLTELSPVRYLEFFHAVPVANFDVAEMRRKMGFVRIPDLDCVQDQEVRMNTYQQALNELESFLAENENGVGILDAALTTHELRHMVMARVSSSSLTFPISVCVSISLSL